MKLGYPVEILLAPFLLVLFFWGGGVWYFGKDYVFEQKTPGLSWMPGMMDESMPSLQLNHLSRPHRLTLAEVGQSLLQFCICRAEIRDVSFGWDKIKLPELNRCQIHQQCYVLQKTYLEKVVTIFLTERLFERPAANVLMGRHLEEIQIQDSKP